jgi:acid phosphatase family membrane protein YuiD
LAANPVFVYSISAWAIAQAIKLSIAYFRERRLDLSLLVSAGGMPSSHSAFVCSIAVAIAFREGLNSSLFALAVGLAGVVMYDAAGVRRAAGRQATVLNLIVGELFQGHPMSEEKLQELLGHTPTQVFLGAVLGILFTWIGMAYIWDGS